MNANKPYKAKRFRKLLGVSSLAAAFILVGLPLAAQQQDQDTVPGYPAPGGQQPNVNAAPPPYAGNQGPAGGDQNEAPPPQAPQNGAPPYPPPPPPNGQNPSLPRANQPVPASLTLPAGTIVQIRTNEWLSTDRNLPGDGFHATLDQPVVAVGGWVVAQHGQNVLGRVTMSQKANSSNHNQSQLGLTLSEMTFVDGQLLPIETQFVQNSGAPSDPNRNVGIVGSTTGAGAIIGAIAGGGTGAAVGAGVGAIAGLGIITTHGRPTAIPPETLLTFQLKTPVTISTDKSKFAFRPISPADYSGNASNRGYQQNQGSYQQNQGNYEQGGPGEPGAYPPTPPPPAPPYYGYPYAYSPYYYPYGYYGYYPSFGFGYGYGYGWGPRYYGRFGRRFR